MPTITITSGRTRREFRLNLRSLPEKMRSRAFLSRLSHSIFTRLHESFEDRSAGGVGRYGGDWAPLTPARRRFKAKKRPGTENTINIFTKRLINSFRPYPRNSNGLSPSRDQILNIRHGQLTIGSRVKYAKHVNAQRSLLPDRFEDLLRDSIAETLEEEFR